MKILYDLSIRVSMKKLPVAKNPKKENTINRIILIFFFWVPVFYKYVNYSMLYFVENGK